jgi:hypothetical protein
VKLDAIPASEVNRGVLWIFRAFQPALWHSGKRAEARSGVNISKMLLTPVFVPGDDLMTWPGWIYTLGKSVSNAVSRVARDCERLAVAALLRKSVYRAPTGCSLCATQSASATSLEVKLKFWTQSLDVQLPNRRQQVPRQTPPCGSLVMHAIVLMQFPLDSRCHGASTTASPFGFCNAISA